MANTTSNRRTLFDTTGSGDAFVVPGYAKRLISLISAAWGGAIKLQVSVAFNEAGVEEWQDFPSASYTADTIAVLDIPAGKYRWTNVAATGPAAATMGE